MTLSLCTTDQPASSGFASGEFGKLSTSAGCGCVAGGEMKLGSNVIRSVDGDIISVCEFVWGGRG